jgi:hypothetical protein
MKNLGSACIADPWKGTPGILPTECEGERSGSVWKLSPPTRRQNTFPTACVNQIQRTSGPDNPDVAPPVSTASADPEADPDGLVARARARGQRRQIARVPRLRETWRGPEATG